MHVHVFQHLPYEGLGALSGWLEERGAFVTRTCFWEADATQNPPPPSDWLVVLGGSMGAYEEDRYPWLVTEKQWIREALQVGRRVLGICLGAQLLADVLGGKVFPHSMQEPGWIPVQRTAEASDHPLLAGVPDTLNVFHWHGDTFTLPPGASQLWRSAFCEQQAFVWNDQALGLQCHPEITPEMIADWTRLAKNDWVPSDSMASREALLDAARNESACAALKNPFARLMENWMALSSTTLFLQGGHSPVSPVQ
ncbi:MAG: type 1 glutamine amidotransferase [Candidatus Melainabacteria bacterium]